MSTKQMKFDTAAARDFNQGVAQIARVVAVSDVGLGAIHVHDATAQDPGAAFALSRISHGPTGPTPIGVFRDASAPVYDDMMTMQLVNTQADKGPGDLAKLVTSMGTWTVE